VQAAGIVEALDVTEQIASGLGPGVVNPVMDPLGLEVWKKLSIGALSQQSPLRLMDGVIPDWARAER
jgi:hypothetical protein